MEEKSHIQWAIYCIDNSDYYVSLNQDSLNKIKEWNIIKSKIVYLSNKGEIIRNLIQKNLFITLLTDKERIKNRWETKITDTTDSVRLKISNSLLNTLIGKNPEEEWEDDSEKEWEKNPEKKSKDGPKNYEHRYNAMQDKIHFLIKDEEKPFSEKSWFDDTFELCEGLNKKLPEQLYLFEDEYINVHNKSQDS